MVNLLEEKERNTGRFYNVGQIKNGICMADVDAKISYDDVVENITNTKMPNISKEQLDEYNQAYQKLMKNVIEE